MLNGDTSAARKQFDEARTEFEALLYNEPAESRPGQIWLRASLALVLAGLGERTQAMQQAIGASSPSVNVVEKDMRLAPGSSIPSSDLTSSRYFASAALI